METSSPLAAMHPPAPVFGGSRDIFASRPHAHLSANPRGSGGGFNLRDHYAQRSNADYFNIKSVRGSSPAASLAADLSANFRIDNDMSPHFPTPRRALFTTTTIMGAMEGREYATTPPLPASSSPAGGDMMDISPLPLKAPFVTQIEVHSPTPAATPNVTTPSVASTPGDDDMMQDSPIPRQNFLEPPHQVIPERRKLGLRRPSLSRTKGYSTGGVAGRLQGDGQLAHFKLAGLDGADSRAASPSSLSLSECFEDSPPQERRPQSSHSPSANAPGALRSRTHFSSLGGASAVRNGSPIVAHARRPSNPFSRPRRQYRRSLSMFENPADMIKQKKDESSPPALQAVMDMEEPAEPVLPHFMPDGQNDNIPRINRSTMLDVLDGRYNEHFDQKVVIDCRFEYEYDGGHIDGAVNYNDKDLLSCHLFETPMEGRTLLIFHCEYSAHRAPLMARHVRSEDRTFNAECYPRLTYPEVYILEGGYSGFFAEHRERCYPQAYVEMDAAEHASTCEREMDRLRQNRRSLHRAQTFAFGQQERSVYESPTAPGRGTSCDESPMMMGNSPSLGHERGHARRMVSF